jgi:transcriptional regulator with XRE-family HTH domain
MSNRIHLKVKHKKLKGSRGPWRPSDLARELGVSPQAFASYENGLNRVPADVLIKWCETLKLHPAAVIVEEDKKVIEALAAE